MRRANLRNQPGICRTLACGRQRSNTLHSREAAARVLRTWEPSMDSQAVKHPAQKSDYKKVLQELVFSAAAPSLYFANKAVPLIAEAGEIELVKLAQVAIAYFLHDAPAARDALNEARLKKYVDYLGEDMGMFSGCYARRVLDRKSGV